MRSGTELLFLPCGIGRLPNRLVSGCGGFVKIQFSYYITGFLILIGVLLGRFICGFCVRSDGFRNCYIRYRQKSFPLKAEAADIHKICSFAFAVGLLPMLITNDVGMGDPFSVSIFVLKGYSRGQSLFPPSIRESAPHWVRSFRGSWAY